MVLGVLVGNALSVVGTDETSESAPLTVKDGTYAVVLDEAIVPYTGSNVTVTATNSQGTDLFIGTANGIDVDSYLDGVSQTQISDVHFPDEPAHRSLPGDAQPASPIVDRDWWVSKDTGSTVTKTFDLDVDPQVLVIAPAKAGENLDGTTVTLTMKVAGVFGWSLVGIAVAVILLGFAAFFALRWWGGIIRPERKPLTPRTGPGRYGSMDGADADDSDGNGDGSDGDDDSGPDESGPGGGSARPSSPHWPGGSTPTGETPDAAAPPRPQAPPTSPPPRRRDLRSKRTMRSMRTGLTIALGSALALSGCSLLPIAQPQTPHVTPYQRTAVRPGEAGAYMTTYTESLQKIIEADGDGLETIQGAPLIERTRAQILIAKRAKQKLSAPDFTEVVAGGPLFEKYPMWFYAFGTTSGKDATTQVQLVTRDSASADPIVRAATFIPKDAAPTLLADGTGAVAPGPKDFTSAMKPAAEAVAKSLSDGTTADPAVKGLDSEGFTSFRDYLKQLQSKESGFDKVTATCAPYTDFDFSAMTLSTKEGAIGLGEVRCEITITVPKDYSVDLGDTIEAVKTNDKKGDTVKVETASPYALIKKGKDLTAVSTSWDVISSKIE